jgi:hypothetical protein
MTTPQAPDAGLRKALEEVIARVRCGDLDPRAAAELLGLGFDQDGIMAIFIAAREALSAVPTVDVGGEGNSSSGVESAACGLTASTDQERIAQLERALKKLTLFRNPDEEIVHYAGLCIDAAEEGGRELLHEDLCRLSVVFGRGSDLRDDRDRRINERLKAMIAKAVTP